PIEMQIPALNMSAEFEENDCRVKDGAINPDTLNLACTYTSTDRPYSLPGTDSTDVVVIAGHTGAVVPAVFNKLYDGRANKHRIALGDKLYIRTDKSANFWLEYTATDLHEPEKAGLSQSADIWGTTATPGRLLTISCIQPANPLANSVKNAVVGWQFSQVTSEPTTS
ncbi:MAG: hypothetical protein SPK16_09760, partial [Corynebacterium sp.]|nr:hypothetical protein [Corynebacterium sp.]